MKLGNVVGRLAGLLPAVLLAGGLLATPQVASAQGAPVWAEILAVNATTLTGVK